MKMCLLLALSLLWLGSSNAGLAVQLRQMALAEQVAKAEVVVIARTISMPAAGGDPRELAHLAVEVALKGRPAKTFVLVHSLFAEEGANCCKIGERYLLLLTRLPDGKYVSVNGAFATIPIGPSASVFPDMPMPWIVQDGEFHHPE